MSDQAKRIADLRAEKARLMVTYPQIAEHAKQQDGKSYAVAYLRQVLTDRHGGVLDLTAVLDAVEHSLSILRTRREKLAA